MSHIAYATGTTTATLTPPSSSHGGRADWAYLSKGKMRNEHEDEPYLNGTSQEGALAFNGDHAGYDNVVSEFEPRKENVPRTGRSASVADSKRPANERSQSYDPKDQSKWIHRDKLAKIENEELQAAGIVLPRVRGASRSRRDRSQDKASLQRRDTDNSAHHHSRPVSRKNSVQSDWTPEVEVPVWDLRLPDEIAEDANEQYWTQPDQGKTKIPVAKQSPAPIPADYLERDAPVARKSSHGTLLDDDQSFSLSKPRTASGSSHILLDESPKNQTAKRPAGEGSPKKLSGPRKGSGPGKSAATSTGRPKTRSGSTTTNGRSTSTTRPSTRSGELRAPEGDPPWMVSAYKPDPRLPPDQQLLPTVAKRLQQEQWEKEGKFGNVYDTEFRPLNEQALLSPPELKKPKMPSSEEPEQGEWPLRADAKSPTVGSRPGTSSYSTMPKIQDQPAITPISSPRIGGPAPQPMREKPKPEPLQLQDEEKSEDKSGCGCCLVM